MQRPGGILSGRGHGRRQRWAQPPQRRPRRPALTRLSLCFLFPTLSGVLRSVLGLSAFPVMLAVHSPTVPPPLAWPGWRNGALEAHRLLRALWAPWRSAPRQRAGGRGRVLHLFNSCRLQKIQLQYTCQNMGFRNWNRNGLWFVPVPKLSDRENRWMKLSYSGHVTALENGQPLRFRYQISKNCTMVQIFSTMVLTCGAKHHRFSADVSDRKLLEIHKLSRPHLNTQLFVHVYV